MRICKTFIFLNLLSVLFYGCSLPVDDEQDTEQQDATHALPWTGETVKFTMNSKEGIHLNDPQGFGGTAYLTIPSTEIRNMRWEFGVRLSFNPSANNFARFYLGSSSQILSGPLDGYYLQIGGAKDNVSLYRQDGSKSRLLASGRELMKGDKSPDLYIKVECDRNGYWTFWTRLKAENEYTKEKQVKEDGIRSSVCCGVYCVYTKSRCDGFSFHHVKLSSEVETNTTPKEENGDPVPPDVADPTELPDDVRGNLLFNEVMYHPTADGSEYVEIYNPTDKAITLPVLYLYRMQESGMVYGTTLLQNEDTAKPLTIPSKGYLCFTKSVHKVMRKHNVGQECLVGISRFPSLNNHGGYLALSASEKVTKGRTFDTCRFIDWMHDAKNSRTHGVALEKKSPDLPSLNANWHSSKDNTGGTPGRKNSEEDTFK